ncbi:hypothetical protein ABUE34_15110 (plasmid) [Kozakia baliensis]|uniref:hypothetical protein n=1 Tax=Kozakia baliensis TaxID=153496 RepID=UPI00345C0B5F
MTMQSITINTEASQLVDQLLRRGVSSHARIRAIIEIRDDGLDMTTISASGRGFEWLADKPELYTDADLIGRDA